MTPGVFKAFLYYAAFKKIKSNWTVAQTDTLSCRNENLSIFASIVTIEINTTSCIGTF